MPSEGFLNVEITAHVTFSCNRFFTHIFLSRPFIIIPYLCVSCQFVHRFSCLIICFIICCIDSFHLVSWCRYYKVQVLFDYLLEICGLCFCLKRITSCLTTYVASISSLSWDVLTFWKYFASVNYPLFHSFLVAVPSP